MMTTGEGDHGEPEKKHYVLNAEPGHIGVVGGSASLELRRTVVKALHSKTAFWIGLLFAAVCGAVGPLLTWPNPFVISIGFSIVAFLIGCFLLPPWLVRLIETTIERH